VKRIMLLNIKLLLEEKSNEKEICKKCLYIVLGAIPIEIIYKIG
jgi:hypothetical protein